MGNPVRGTGGELLTNNSALQIREMRKEMVTLSAAANQLSSLTIEASVNVKNQYEFEMMYLPARPSVLTVEAVNASTLQFAAADLPWVQVGMQLRKDGDTVTRVTAVDYTAGTYQVTIADSAASKGIAAGTVLSLGAPASGENSAAPTPLTRVPETVTQYISTIRCAYGLSRHAASSANYRGIAEFENRKECMAFMKECLERSAWMDAKDKITGPPLTYKSGGLIYVATAAGNVITLEDNVLTLGGMRQAVRLACRYMPSKRIMWFVSPKGSELLDRISLEKAVPTKREDIPTLGVSATVYSFGKKDLVVYEVDQLADSGMENEMFLLDGAGLGAATTKHQGTGRRNWMLEETDAQTPGTDGTIGVFTCDFGMDLVPAWCWRIKGAANYRV